MGQLGATITIRDLGEMMTAEIVVQVCETAAKEGKDPYLAGAAHLHKITYQEAKERYGEALVTNSITHTYRNVRWLMWTFYNGEELG